MWMQQHMMKGTDPRELLKELISADSNIPEDLDQLTLWKIIFNILSEPPKRKKLPNVNTIDDISKLIMESKNIVVITGAGVSVSCGIPDFRYA
jgi:NAD-dependent deacetylase sirtuin 1